MSYNLIIRTIVSFFAISLLAASSASAENYTPTEKEIEAGERSHYCVNYGNDVYCSWEDFWCWYTDGGHFCQDWARTSSDGSEIDALIAEAESDTKKESETSNLAGREQMCVYLGDDTYYCTNGTVYCVWGEEWFCDFV